MKRVSDLVIVNGLAWLNANKSPPQSIHQMFLENTTSASCNKAKTIKLYIDVDPDISTKNSTVKINDPGIDPKINTVRYTNLTKSGDP